MHRLPKEMNWNKIYFLILLYNAVLVFLFYLLRYFFNHQGI